MYGAPSHLSQSTWGPRRELWDFSVTVLRLQPRRWHLYRQAAINTSFSAIINFWWTLTPGNTYSSVQSIYIHSAVSHLQQNYLMLLSTVQSKMWLSRKGFWWKEMLVGIQKPQKVPQVLHRGISMESRKSADWSFSQNLTLILSK